MDDIRIKRYHDKIDYIIDNIEDLPIEPKNKFETRGIFYSLQTSIESMMDLVAMATKDLGIPVRDDATNISELIKNRELEPDLGEKLNKANGMRNLIVHRYNSIEEQIILDSVEEIKTLLYRWLDVIEVILNEFGKLE